MSCTRTITFTLNGVDVSIDTQPMRRLLDVLRLDTGHTGTKEGCGEGECGACTVLCDGVAILACLTPVCQVEGCAITTIEGVVAEDGTLHPLQRTFVELGGTQCGICTPGMILTAKSLLDRNPDPSRTEIREGLAGCLCRCTGYQRIVDAVEEAARELR